MATQINTMIRVILLGGVLGALATSFGCSSPRRTTRAWVSQKTLIKEREKGVFRYKVYIMPNQNQAKTRAFSKKSKVPLVLSIRVINKDGGVSPLRGICQDLRQYSILYEYLLNAAKNDFVLLNGNEFEYPIYYSFENNYNAFPFETINIGYSGSVNPSATQLKKLRLLYMDKIFSHDTLLLNLGQSITL